MGGSLNFLPWMNTATGQTYGGEEIISNFFNPTSLGGVMGAGRGSGQDAPAEIDSPTPPPDPAIAQAEATETARTEEMRKRRLRTKTLLTDQEATGNATVGTKVLLGG